MRRLKKQLQDTQVFLDRVATMGEKFQAIMLWRNPAQVPRRVMWYARGLTALPVRRSLHSW